MWGGRGSVYWELRGRGHTTKRGKGKGIDYRMQSIAYSGTAGPWGVHCAAVSRGQHRFLDGLSHVGQLPRSGCLSSSMSTPKAEARVSGEERSSSLRLARQVMGPVPLDGVPCTGLALERCPALPGCKNKFMDQYRFSMNYSARIESKI